ncbi:MAG: cell division protein ZapA [Deltaproteobacteria bacterium]
MATLNLFGNTYELRSENSQDDLESVIEFVHEKAREAMEQGHGLPPHRIQVLMILNIAHEVLKLRQKLNFIEEKHASVTAGLIAYIDSVIKDDEGK